MTSVWPWEHLAVGYLLYSGLVRARTGRTPTGDAVVVLAAATQLPDLVDKPLAWSLGLLPGGTSLAHSLLVAVPAVVAVALVARRRGHPARGQAFAVGYLAHPPGDVLYPVLLGGDPKVAFLLWPVVPADPSGVDGVLPHLQELAATFVGHLATPAGVAYLALEAGLLSAALLAWVLDGAPGLPARGGRDPGRPDRLR